MHTLVGREAYAILVLKTISTNVMASTCLLVMEIATIMVPICSMDPKVGRRLLVVSFS